jgi:hypothetical protein
LLGEQFGLRPALFICSAGMPLSVIWICLSSARKVRSAEEITPPEPEPEAAPAVQAEPSSQPEPEVESRAQGRT